MRQTCDELDRADKGGDCVQMAGILVLLKGVSVWVVIGPKA